MRQPGTAPNYRNYLIDTLTSNIAFDGYCLEARFPDIGKKCLMINGRIMKQAAGSRALILLAIQDITE